MHTHPQASGHTENRTAGSYQFKELRVTSDAVVTLNNVPSFSSASLMRFQDNSRLVMSISDQQDGVEPVLSAQTLELLGTMQLSWTGRLTVTARTLLHVAAGVKLQGRGGGYGANTALPGCAVDGQVGSGGSYGGYGGPGQHVSYGSTPCGSFVWPHERGAGGITWGSGTGGNGGASVALIANATIDTVLQLDGTIDVAGNVGGNGGSSGGGGGGAGGGVVVEARYLRGGGNIVANGGNGAWTGWYRGGGGSGGRVAFHIDVNEFTGTAQSCGGWYGTTTGGGDFGHGSPGTVFWSVGKDKALRTRTLTVDNCGVNGASAHLTEGWELYTFEAVQLTGGGELSVVRARVDTCAAAGVMRPCSSPAAHRLTPWCLCCRPSPATVWALALS